jgi:GH25 family lysozyme M1 (1,4-beta-N-acetylmuramidase)
MALGIDIYKKYQTVTNYSSVKNAGVTFAWIKATDGFGIASGGAADKEVRGFQSVGIPVGLYHFSQAGSPESQAAILLSEVRRLGATNVVPMLDMEDNPAGSDKPNIPMVQKRDWVARFANYVRAHGFVPCVYMNNSDAKTIRPDTIAPDLVIVIARYGLKPSYGGRYDVHQYSSSGTIAGIVAGGVDLDESYTSKHLLTIVDTPSEDVMTGVLPQSLPPAPDGDYLGFPIEVGRNSSLIASQWIALNATWGDVEYELICIGPNQTLMSPAGDSGYPTAGTLKDRQRAVWALPDGCEGVALKYKTLANGNLGIAFPQRTK